MTPNLRWITPHEAAMVVYVFALALTILLLGAGIALVLAGLGV